MRVLLAVSATLLAALVLVSPVSAVTFVVNSLDGDLDNVCDDANCTIRDAVFAANNNPGLDTITFDLPGTAPYIIHPDNTAPE